MIDINTYFSIHDISIDIFFLPINVNRKENALHFWGKIQLWYLREYISIQILMSISQNTALYKLYDLIERFPSKSISEIILKQSKFKNVIYVKLIIFCSILFFDTLLFDTILYQTQNIDTRYISITDTQPYFLLQEYIEFTVFICYYAHINKSTRHTNFFFSFLNLQLFFLWSLFHPSLAYATKILKIFSQTSSKPKIFL